MKTILSLMVVGLVFFGIMWLQEGENPLNKLSEKSPTRHIQSAEEAASIYGSATDKRLEAEFGAGY